MPTFLRPRIRQIPIWPVVPPPPAAKTFQVSLQGVSAIDRSDGSAVRATGGSVSGATATQP